jgi:hypothetical protein
LAAVVVRWLVVSLIVVIVVLLALSKIGLTPSDITTLFLVGLVTAAAVGRELMAGRRERALVRERQAGISAPAHRPIRHIPS